MEQETKLIPNSLRIVRRRFGYSRKTVAVLLELTTPADLSRWERGANMPNSMNLLKLSALYRTSANELYYDMLNTIKQQITMKESKMFNHHESEL